MNEGGCEERTLRLGPTERRKKTRKMQPWDDEESEEWND